MKDAYGALDASELEMEVEEEEDDEVDNDPVGERRENERDDQEAAPISSPMAAESAVGKEEEDRNAEGSSGTGLAAPHEGVGGDNEHSSKPAAEDEPETSAVNVASEDVSASLLLQAVDSVLPSSAECVSPRIATMRERGMTFRHMRL